MSQLFEYCISWPLVCYWLLQLLLYNEQVYKVGCVFKLLQQRKCLMNLYHMDFIQVVLSTVVSMLHGFFVLPDRQSVPLIRHQVIPSFNGAQQKVMLLVQFLTKAVHFFVFFCCFTAICTQIICTIVKNVFSVILQQRPQVYCK